MSTKMNEEEKEMIHARYDSEMNKYDDIVLFPEKLAKAKEKFKNVNFKDFVKKLDELKTKE